MRRAIGSFFGFIFTIVNLVLLLVVGGGLLAKFFRPEYFWPAALVANFLPYTSLALLFSWFISLRRKKALWILVNTLVLAYSLFRMSYVIQKNDFAEIGSEDLSVATQNIPRVPEDLPAQADMLRSMEKELPHLIAVQESGVFTLKKQPDIGKVQAKLRVLFDTLGYYAPPAKRLDSGGNWYNLQQPILSSIQILDQEEFIFEKGDGDPDPLYMSRSLLEWNGRKVALFNVHLRTHGRHKPWYGDIKWWSPEFWSPYISQLKEAYTARSWQIDQIAGKIADENLPFLLVGDFNSSPFSWSYTRISDELQDVFAISSRGLGNTYHVRLPLVRIDYVFASEDWIPVSSRVGSSTKLVSDHKPLFAKVRLR